LRETSTLSRVVGDGVGGLPNGEGKGRAKV